MDKILFHALFSVLAVLCWSKPQHNTIVRMNQGIEAEIFKRERPNLTAEITFSFAKHFQDHMVLQQAPQKANIYGFSPYIGKRVFAMLTIDDKNFHYKTVVRQGPESGLGVWFITLDAIKSSSAASIYVASGKKTLTLHDVLFGDVWFCSGQSNMAFRVAWMTNGDEEIANAHKYPQVRILDVARRRASTPQFDLLAISTNWSLPSNETLPKFSAMCWLYGKNIHIRQGYPIGLIASDWEGTNIAAWSSPDALATCGLDKPTAARKRHSSADLKEAMDNSVLWNAMVHPLLGFTLYGVLWYQGEADSTVDRMDLYNCTFPAMIDDWRLKFSTASRNETFADFPFGFMQLGPERDNPDVTQFPGFPDVRWHQTSDIGFVPNNKMHNVFMAVAMDLPDFRSPYGPVHYRDKTDAAYRITLSGLAIAYQYDEFFQGPFPKKGSVESGGYLTIDYGSDAMLNVKTVYGFEVLCAAAKNDNPIWIPALISSSNSTSITLYTGDCTTSYEAVRYAWEISPCPFKECAVYETRNDLPGPPFIEYATKDSNGHIWFQFS